MKEIGAITVLKTALLAVVLAGIWASSGQATQQPQVPTLEVPPSEWEELDTWDRGGDNDTQSFHVDSELWRVVWDADTDSVGQGDFIVHVYNVDGTFHKFLFDSTLYEDKTLKGPLRGTLGISGAGDYFLRVSTTRSSNIGIEEARG